MGEEASDDPKSATEPTGGSPSESLSRGAFRAVFFGTPQFAVPCLDALVEVANVTAVVCQPDRPQGRGLTLTPPPVKQRALELGLDVVQPTKLKTGEFAQWLRDQNADVALVVAYGRILPKDVLDAPRLGCVNVHASLLPRLRGAAPITWAIVRGEPETGVTLMQMDEGMDTGPVLASARTPIDPDETGGELGTRLSLLGAELLKREWTRLLQGALTAIPQDNTRATVAPMLRKEDGCIRWSHTAQQVHDRVRGLSPWPGAYSFVDGQRLKIHRTRVLDREESRAVGEVVEASERGIVVACARGLVALEEVQPEGGKRLKATQWLAGHRLSAGARFVETAGETT